MSSNFRLQMVLAASAMLGLTINHSTFLCTQVNEPLMTSVAGNLKNVLMVRISVLMALLIMRSVWSFACTQRVGWSGASVVLLRDSSTAMLLGQPPTLPASGFVSTLWHALVLPASDACCVGDPQTVVGAVAFPDFLYSAPNVLGLALSMIGAVWYAMQSAMRVRFFDLVSVQYSAPGIAFGSVACYA